MYKTENKHIICKCFIGNSTLHRHPRVNVLTSPPLDLSDALYCMPILCRHRDLSPVVFDARTHGRFHRSRLDTREFETRRGVPNTITPRAETSRFIPRRIRDATTREASCRYVHPNARERDASTDECARTLATSGRNEHTDGWPTLSS